MGQKAREAKKLHVHFGAIPAAKAETFSRGTELLTPPRGKLSLLQSAMTNPTLLFPEHNLPHSKLPSQEKAHPAQKVFKPQFTRG